MIQSNNTVLNEPLLIPTDNKILKSPKNKRRSLPHEVYAVNKPKILLEQITKRTATCVLMLTYIVFIICFCVDVVASLNSFKDGKRFLNVNLVNNSNTCLENPYNDWSCTFADPYNVNQSIWVGSIFNIGNIISLSLELNANTTLLTSEETTLTYDVTLYACLNTPCPVNVSSFEEFSSFDDKDWNEVLNNKKEQIVIDPGLAGSNAISDYEIFGNTFQNQEALPVNSQIDSYFAIITFYHPISEIVYVNDYDFELVTRDESPVADALLPIAIFITLVVFIAYLNALYKHDKNFNNWLAEQKWIICYFVALLLYQNPVYCVLVYLEKPTPSEVFSSYIFEYCGQASFLTIWLLFADGLQRKKQYFMFYIPKILFGSFVLATQFVVLTLQFPSLNPYDGRSPVEAVTNWTEDTKKTFIAFSITFLLLLWIWVIWWFYTLYCSFSLLNKLPYMTTRYLQLSFRYFLIQASLVAAYYIFQYFIVIFMIFASMPASSSQTVENYTDNINTLFRQQSQLFGRVIFLTSYALILAFLFLPASNQGETVSALSSTYVIDEEELIDVKYKRKIALLKLKNLKILTDLVHAKIDVFCLDIALELLEIAYEVYYDPEGTPTASGYGPMNLDRHNYVLIDYKYNPDHETFCIITKHKITNRIVVAFRGTSNQKHWVDNLNYKKRLIHFEDLKMPELDTSDGLEEYLLSKVNEQNSSSSISRKASAHHHHHQAESSESSHNHNILNSSIQMAGEATQFGIKTVRKVASTMVDVTTTVVGTTTGLVVNYTPGLKNIVLPHIHTGFWEAYSVVREFVHATLRRELTNCPSHVCFTGHSLGGAIASLAAADFTVNSLPRIEAFLDNRKDRLSGEEGVPSYKPGNDTVRVSMYNYGSPRVGNSAFADLFDKLVPDGFRVVVDGDIVSSVPYSSAGFKHIGTEALIDPQGAGSIIIDSSFIERRLRAKSKSSVSVHSLTVYRKGLTEVKSSALKLKWVADRDHTGEQTKDLLSLTLMNSPNGITTTTTRPF